MMILFKLEGGFGNRIIQYMKAFEYFDAGHTMIIISDNPNRDKSELQNIFNFSVIVLKNNIFFRTLYFFSKKSIISLFLSLLKIKPVKGWFQDLNEMGYFLRQCSLEDMVSIDRICVHVRRGDYYSKRFVSNYGNICTKEYYMNAINVLYEIDEELKSKPVTVVTDDHTWVKNNLPNHWDINIGTLYEDWEYMRQSRYLIISNSTFSLTAALLSNKEEVLFPSVWNRRDSNPNLFLKQWRSIQIG